jgi:hypothetical protein
MKKIPTVFTRVFENHKIVDIKDEITPGCEEAFKHGVARVKYDGSCCAIIDGHFYKRYDCKKGKTPPKDAIACCDPDPITGHWPHWVPVKPDDPADRWFMEAFANYSTSYYVYEGTYEAVGPHFQGNPHGYSLDMLVKHSSSPELVDVPRTLEGVRETLDILPIEGIVFWLNGEPVCKIKRSDFGFNWPPKGGVR